MKAVMEKANSKLKTEERDERRRKAEVIHLNALFIFIFFRKKKLIKKNVHCYWLFKNVI
jgi:hypothetical protein